MAYPIDPIYKLFKNADGVEVCVLREKNGIIMSIPLDEENSDYQEYLKWLNGEDPYTEKGTPEPAD